MTLSVGVDIIELDRIQRAVERHGERFLRRIYTAEELARYRDRLPELAARFALSPSGLFIVRWTRSLVCSMVRLLERKEPKRWMDTNALSSEAPARKRG